MTYQGIGWIESGWGNASELKLSIQDRGLTLGDGIFETVLIMEGKPKLLTEHLSRWSKSARLLNMAPPPKEEWIRKLIQEGIQNLPWSNGNGVLRINWSRGKRSTRGIDINLEDNNQLNHQFWLEIHPHEPCFQHLSVMISHTETRNEKSRLSLCKTFGYAQAIQAKYEAIKAGFNDALLLNTRGEICCGTTANLLIIREKEWLTPHIKSGCLPGIMRQQGLHSGKFKEASLEPNPQKGDHWILINSLSCRPITVVNDIHLKAFNDPKNLWLSLLGKKEDTF